MYTLYKFSLEEAKDIIRKANNLPDDAYIEIEWLPIYPIYPTYPDYWRIVGVPNTYPVPPVIYCGNTTPTTVC